MRNVTESTIIDISDEDDAEPSFRMSWGAFLRSNEFSGEEISQMASSLRERGNYTGGGGACPVFMLSVVEQV